MILTRPQREGKVSDELVNRGYETRVYYLRTVRKTRRGRRKGGPKAKIILTKTPILKGYVLCDREPDHRHRDEIDGIRTVMRHPTGQPVRLTALQLRHIEDAANGKKVPHDPLSPGKRVEIRQGIFEYHKGRVERLKDDIAFVRIDGFMSCTRVQIEREHLRPI